MAKVRMRLAKWDARPFIRMVDGEFAARMTRAAAFVATDVRRSMKGGGSPHTPSRPYEVPRIDTGELRRSIRHQVTVENHQVRGYVIAGAPYARALELGYPPGNLLPRPYLRPALARTQPQIVRILIGKPLGGYLSIADIKTATEMGIVSRRTLGGGA